MDPNFLPSHRDPHLLGRLVFTLTRMTSQPSLLNVGRPVFSSCRSRLVAVMFRTTMISMFPPMKLEERASRHHGQSLPLWPLSLSPLCPQSQQLWEEERVRHHPHRIEKKMDLPKVTKWVFPVPSCFGNLLHILQNPTQLSLSPPKPFLIPLTLPVLPLSEASH